MPFSSTLEVTGKPDFGLIKIDPEETARALQTYLNTGSSLTGVSLDDIQRSVIKLPNGGDSATLVDLMAVGMKLFDAIVWITGGRPASHPLQIDPAMKVEAIASLHEVARSVFYCYFMLVVQARYPASSRNDAKPKIPNFLSTIMGMDKPQHVYVETICSFEPQKFDPAWVRHVKFEGFGQETLSRFGLGVAGYRNFGPFKLYPPKAGLPENLITAYNFARNVATAPASWDIHPLTRHPTVLSRRGNLNKNLNNLMLECFSIEDLQEMKKVKIIYDVPEKDPSHRNYLLWAALDDVSGTATIFRT